MSQIINQKLLKDMTTIEAFVQLEWAMLELKLAYYHPQMVHVDWHKYVMRPDAVYDALEDLYKFIGTNLKLKLWVSEIVGFDFERPCCRLVFSKLSKPMNNSTAPLEIYAYITNPEVEEEDFSFL